MYMIFCDLFPDTYSAFDRMICLSLNCLFDGFFLLRHCLLINQLSLYLTHKKTNLFSNKN